jgi:release factor glutamine methyltransferase
VVKTKTTINLGRWFQAARLRFERSAILPALELQVLAAHILGKPRAWVAAHPEYQLMHSQQDTLDALLDRLIAGTPLPYLTGEQEFYGLKFCVTPDVLIPRPETELLVERALSWLKAHPTRLLAADVGVGSGCIGLTIAHAIPELRLVALDRSRPALEVARTNADHLETRHVAFLQSDLLTAVSASFDLVCANLPYIPTPDLAGLAVTHFEPALALDGGWDGLSILRAFLKDAPRWLAPAGLMLLEIEYRQGQAVQKLAQSAFPNADIRIIPDLAGLDRLVEITLP